MPAIVLAVAAFPVARGQEADAEPFLERAQKYWTDLSPAVDQYCQEVDACGELTDVLGAVYDAVLTNENGRFRDTLIDKYNRERPTIVAQMVSLDDETRDLEARLNNARDYLHQRQFDQFRSLSTYRDLSTVLEKGYQAVVAARDIPRLLPLSDPIPEPVPPVEVTSTDFVVLGLERGKLYPVEVRVRNNCHYTKRAANVEILVRYGPAKIKGELKKSITVNPGKTGMLTWQFTPTDDGEFDIGARIVPTP
ncbi:MAG TPA: hypothetical protein VG713_01300 [Pirellulales bacterium]|nr:hypothetical protein [Pirellulales bacterium]